MPSGCVRGAGVLLSQERELDISGFQGQTQGAAPPSPLCADSIRCPRTQGHVASCLTAARERVSQSTGLESCAVQRGHQGLLRGGHAGGRTRSCRSCGGRRGEERDEVPSAGSSQEDPVCECVSQKRSAHPSFNSPSCVVEPGGAGHGPPLGWLRRGGPAGCRRLPLLEGLLAARRGKCVELGSAGLRCWLLFAKLSDRHVSDSFLRHAESPSAEG